MNQIIESDGGRYQLGRLDARRQFHVVRRILPVISKAGVGNMSLGLSSIDQDIATALASDVVISGISLMPDVDIDYIIDTCLSVCKKDQNGHWADVKSGPTIMFPEVSSSMSLMLKLVIGTIQFNLDGFFPSAPLESPRQ